MVAKKRVFYAKTAIQISQKIPKIKYNMCFLLTEKNEKVII
ncbi:hypothetical protein BRYFOR_09278 [Marvinbryantia formatexigens DSM 14469]|uniref:Uncharacterized protein n=1 Tax=Marvinbryantia formatexigens DSM 14469 TaxID=478749 RepID=C6LKT2_9FIRM|nr:hypothetical protein BRYFOR_09278 [Marvinbryantia formatexigens DSM 14469]